MAQTIHSKEAIKMKSLSFLFVVLFTSLLFSCSDKAVATDSTHSNSKSPVIEKCWTNSYEEATNTDQQIFRPCDFKDFPPSHYRLRFDLSSGNVASYLLLSPVDAHHMVPGTWSYDESSKALIIKDSTGVSAHTYQVIDLAADKLVVTGN